MDVGKEGKIEMEGVFAWGGVCTMEYYSAVKSKEILLL